MDDVSRRGRWSRRTTGEKKEKEEEEEKEKDEEKHDEVEHASPRKKSDGKKL